MFEKKKEQPTIEMVETSAPQISIMDEQRAMIQGEVNKSLLLTQTDSIQRTEEMVPPEITRFIDLFEKNEDTGNYEAREDEFGDPLDLMGALGNIPPSQMPYIALSNFNNIWIKLREGIYMDVYAYDKKTGALDLENGEPKLLYTKKISIGVFNRKLQLLANLAYEQNRAKLQAETMVGHGGGSPLSIGWDKEDSLRLLFGGQGKKK